MVAYSIFCYIFQVKDQYNDNIIYIDFGFILTSSPGNNIKFENVSFKLTKEFIQIMDGQDSKLYLRFFFFAICKRVYYNTSKYIIY